MNTTYLKLFIGVLLFATWVALVALKVPDSQDIITAIKMALAGLGVYHLGDRPIVSVTTSPPDKQGGFTSLGMLAVLAVVAMASLSGCASVQQAVQAYGSVAVTSTRAANDTMIEAQKIAFCGLPLSAITRHPEIIPAVRVLCLAPGDKTGAELLDAAQAAQQAKS